MSRTVVRILLLVCILFYGQVMCKAAPIALRGVVEGFYGTPWSKAERLDFFAFAEKVGFNAYIYAPKDDPYHRAKWREPYPPEKLHELGELAQASRSRGVRFIFAVSPGLDVALSGMGRYGDREKLLAKMEALYAQGVRDFAVCFDDIREKDGAGQAELLCWLSERIRERHADARLLLTVPTEYFLADMRTANGAVTPYTRDFSAQSAKDVLVLYTGDGVAKNNLTDASYQSANRLYGCPLALWWNYPANDYMEEKLALGPIEGLPQASSIPAVFFNPMRYEALSKLALATGAAYARNPAAYDPDEAWQDALRSQYGTIAGAMAQFAAHSTHLENDWANIGRPDGVAFSAKAARVLSTKGTETDFAAMDEEIRTIRCSILVLKAKLPKEILAECQPQLQQLLDIADASGVALDILRAEKTGDVLCVHAKRYELSQKMQEIERRQDKARISEGAGMAFIASVMKRN